MRREILRGMNGKLITRLWPENEDDLAELHRLAASGELDARESFGDDPEVWERREREGRVPHMARKKYITVNGVTMLVDKE